MNKFKWLATFLFAVTAASVAFVLTNDLSEPGVDLALKVLSTGTGIAATIFGVAGSVQSRSDKSTVPKGPVRQIGRPLLPEQIRPEPESRSAFLRQMTAHLLAIEAEQGRTDLAANPAVSSGIVEPAMLPILEWLHRRSGGSLATAEAEQISVGELPSRFQRSVLLGEPGSGKSTCLRHIALTRLQELAIAQSTGLPAKEQDPSQLPLYVSLSDWTLDGPSAEEFLRGRLESLLGQANFYVANFQDLLSNGAFMLLLDGLNEMPTRRHSRNEGGPDNDRPSHALSLSGFQALTGRMDRREASLRELAQNLGVRATFILSCRSHEYFDSLDWQVVRLSAISTDQIDRYLNLIQDPAKAQGLRQLFAASPTLTAIASNPFFLVTLTHVYEPGLEVDSRGTILRQLLRTVLALQQETGRGSLTEATAVEVFGTAAFHMLKAGQIGSQAAVPQRQAADQPVVDSLVDAGLLTRRNQQVYFRHQIMQEFFVAAALDAKVIRRSPMGLLRDQRYAEVVALWTDLNPDTRANRVTRALRARNFPWRRPASGSSGALIGLQIIVWIAAAFISIGYLMDWIVGVHHYLPGPLPMPFVPDVSGYWSPAIAVIAIYLFLRLAGALTHHGPTIANAAHVLSITDTRSSIPKVVKAFRRCLIVYRRQLARSLGQFGKAATPHVIRGTTAGNWRVRSGCVEALGELIRNDRTDMMATDALLSLARVTDLAIIRARKDALGWCLDPRVPQAVALIQEFGSIYDPTRANTYMPTWQRGAEAHWDGSILDLYDRLLGSPSAMLHASVLQLVGAVRPAGAERWLAGRVYTEPSLELQLLAIRSLAMTQSGAAATEMTRLAETFHDRGQSDRLIAASTALSTIAVPDALEALLAAAESDVVEIKQGAAIALGRHGGARVVSSLTALSTDSDARTRELAVEALGRAQCLEAAAQLSAVVRDGSNLLVREAMDVLCEHYPLTAGEVLPPLAEDIRFGPRREAVRWLGALTSPAARKALRGLAGDVDPAVAKLARRALAEVRRDEQAAAGRNRWLHPFRTARHSIASSFHFDELVAMRREEIEKAGRANSRMRVVTRLSTDAQLKVRHRNLITAYGILVTVVIVLLGVVVSAAMRALLWLFVAIGHHWLWPTVIASAALITMVPGIRRGEDVVGLGIFIWAIRWLAVAAVVLYVAGAVVYGWWIAVVLIYVAVFVGWLLLVRTRRRIRHALAEGPPRLDSDDPDVDLVPEPAS